MLLFYNAETGDGATAVLDGAGNYTFVASIPGFATGWTHITGTASGGVLFYNASTGLGRLPCSTAPETTLSWAVSPVSRRDGPTSRPPIRAVFSFTMPEAVTARRPCSTAPEATLSWAALSGFATGWTHITGTASGGVLFYKAPTGLGATAVSTAPETTLSWLTIPGFAPGWTHIASANSGSLLFYDAGSGDGASGPARRRRKLHFRSLVSPASRRDGPISPEPPVVAYSSTTPPPDSARRPCSTAPETTLSWAVSPVSRRDGPTSRGFRSDNRGPLRHRQHR